MRPKNDLDEIGQKEGRTHRDMNLMERLQVLKDRALANLIKATYDEVHIISTHTTQNLR